MHILAAILYELKKEELQFSLIFLGNDLTSK